MKHIFTFTLALFISTLIFAQTAKTIQTSTKIGHAAKETGRLQIKGVSPATAIFMLKLQDAAFTKNIAESETFRSQSGIKQINGNYYVNSFIIASDQADLSRYGVLNGTKKGKISTGLVPIDQLYAVSADKEVSYLQIGQQTELKLDAALAATWVHEAHQGAGGLSQAYSGEGVVVGVIDMGFDFTHPTFYDSTYTNYRVKRVWNQIATSGTPPDDFDYGAEYTTEASILAAQTDDEDESHGTHVAGTAAGSGAGTNGVYKGVAFESDLVLVRVTGADSDIADAVSYIFDYTESVGKAAVINISLGSHVGPHDGTSQLDQFYDEAVGKGKILVGSAGNEGSDPLYIEKTFSATDTLMYSFLKFPRSTTGTSGSTPIDMWGTTNTNFSVSVGIYNTESNLFEARTPYIFADSDDSFSFVLYDGDDISPDSCVVEISTEINAENEKPRIFVQLDHSSQDDNFRWAMIEVIGHDTEVKMWANSGFFVSNDYPAPVVAGSSSSTVGEAGGTGNSIISVGAYTAKNSYTNLSNQTFDIAYPTALGEIAPFSSLGPTADNRTKPDITAPGNVIVASVNSFDDNYSATSQQTIYSVTKGEKTWYYGSMQGTSMSSPMVTGIVALLLEAYPELDKQQVLELLKDQAYRDEFTGEIPDEGDNTWGWGKIDAETTLLELESLIPAMPAISPDGNMAVCEGETQTLTAPAGFSIYAWNTGDSTQSIVVNAAGNYYVRVANENGLYSAWSAPASLVVNAKPDTPIVTNNSDTLTSTAAAAYQWYFNNSIIEGATQQIHIAKNSGLYHVFIANENNCTAASTPINVTVSSVESIEYLNQFMTISPNPSNGIFAINSLLAQPIAIEIVDAAGRLVTSYANINPGKTTIEMADLGKGVYFIRFKVDGKVLTQKLLIN